MKVSVDAYTFTTKADGDTLVDIELQDAEAISAFVVCSAHAGTATTTNIELIPRVGAVIFGAGDVIGTQQFSNETTGFPLNRIGASAASKTVLLPNAYWIPATFKQARVRAELTGAAHTITGTVYIMRLFR